ncbi:MAE_28990/MAE_18760 family HEPN-like nuclease [Stutzerimonas frequens]|uniref:MAE_28990/MAE_18760 family HEPN-like nuclease n=1 Tax=Stutzerimonas frequens TaxID=2968969 RepID=UPI0022DE19B1|nr:MAE_28990/MAE_18760 family HEPN-like nuclease [Stutzerimonas frequens]MDA0427320.1 MAE_28990/MAE_18760 family HEPN-like nuclease [Stutzerimonas frequens]
MTDVLDALTRDLDWRETEIATMRVLLSASSSNIQRRTLLRAAWAMLYAHYEGFCKEALTIYFDAISKAEVVCSELPASTQVFALAVPLNLLKHSSVPDFLEGVKKFHASYMEKAPVFPEVDTQSNLWPNVLNDLLVTADLSCSKILEHEAKLRTLVSRRNEIAHGKNNLIDEVSYYLGFEQAVYDVMYDLALQIDERLSCSPFKS